jgi:hypothetical protein
MRKELILCFKDYFSAKNEENNRIINVRILTPGFCGTLLVSFS